MRAASPGSTPADRTNRSASACPLARDRGAVPIARHARIGGFHDAKAASPGPDWVLLARAQAAGASIGVLQEPAFHYRRNFDTADLSWQKYDQHGVRHLVHSHYGQSYDPDLVAKLAQHLMVEYYR